MRNSTRLAAIALVGLNMACGSMQVMRVSPGADVNGLRVQMPEPHLVLAVIRGSDGKPIYQSVNKSLVAKDEQYEFDFEGALFVTREIAVEMSPSGTVKKYSFTTDSNIDEALKSASQAAASAGKIRKDVKDSEAEDPDPLEKENAELRTQIINDMLLANETAAKAGLALPYPFLFQ